MIGDLPLHATVLVREMMLISLFHTSNALKIFPYGQDRHGRGKSMPCAKPVHLLHSLRLNQSKPYPVNFAS